MGQPFYIWLGDSADVGQTYEAAGGGSANTQPHQSYVLDDREYDWSARIEGVDGSQRFPDAPGSDSYAPRIWNHDDIHAGTNSIVSISAAASAVVTGSQPHGRSAGETVEIHISGVTGADAADINGVWTGTATGTHAFTIALDTTALDLSAVSATLHQSGWSYYSAQVTSAGKPITSDTDWSLGGTVGADSTDNRRWGAELAMLADLHDRWGEDDAQPHFLCVGHDAGLLAREHVAVEDVEPNANTVITLDTSTLLADPLLDQTVVLWGFTGDYEKLNGEQTARYVDGSTLRFPSVDTAGSDPYLGGGRIAMRPRWHPDVGAEAWDDFTARLGDAVGAATDAGIDLECRGVILGLGYREQASGADDDAETRTGLAVESISTTGFPTTVTLATSHGIEVDSSKHLVTVRLTNCGALDGLHEARVSSENTLELHTTNAATIDTTSAIASVGDPSWAFSDELAGFVADVRSAVATETGDTAANIPVLLVQPRVVSNCGAPWDGTTPFASCAANQRIRHAINAVHAPGSGVSVIQTSALRNAAGDNREMTRGHALYLGHDIATELVLQETRSAAYGTSAGRGAPVYVIAGDDIAAGTVSYLSAYYDANQDYDGTQNFGRGIQMWEHSETAFGDFAAVERSTGSAQPGNSNTHPTWNLNPGNLEGGPGSLVGPDLSLLPLTKARHTSPIYVVKLGVPGAALTTSSRSLRVIGTSVVEIGDEDDDQVDLVTEAPHGRYNYSATVVVTVSGLDSVGVPAGTYTATPQDPSTLRIPLGGAPSGGMPATGTAYVSVPRPSYVESDADIWTAMTTARDQAFSAIRADGLEPDVRGIFVPGMGLNDALYGVTADYQAALVQWFADLRDAWTTRSQPEPALPIVLGRVRTSSEYVGGAATSVYISAVQDAQSAVCSADAAATLVDSDTCAFNSDDATLTYEGYLDLGRLLHAAFDDVDQSCSAVEGSHLSATPSASDFVS